MAFRDAFAILHTPDLERAVAFYVERLGFEERYRFGGGFAVVGLESFDLGFATVDDVEPAGRVAIWLYTDNVDTEIERLRDSGAEVEQDPEDMDWGERVASILDPDGNEVFIGQRVTS